MVGVRPRPWPPPRSVPTIAARGAGLGAERAAALPGERVFLGIWSAFQVPRLLPAVDALALRLSRVHAVLRRRIVARQDAAVAAWFSWTLCRCLNPCKLLALQVRRGLNRNAGRRPARPGRPRPGADLTFEQARWMDEGDPEDADDTDRPPDG